MVKRIRPLAGRASLAVNVMDILGPSLAPGNDGTLSAHALRTQRTAGTLGIELPTRIGSGITAGAGIHYPVLRGIHARAPSLARSSLPSFDIVFSQDRFSRRRGDAVFVPVRTAMSSTVRPRPDRS